MKQILSDIQDGSFAREWIQENKTGGKNFASLREAERQHPIEDVGARLRGMMSWLPGKDGKKAKPAPGSEQKVVNA
jgi:ketol-acid reductoisomerase